jgi:hypothetical protein
MYKYVEKIYFHNLTIREFILIFEIAMLGKRAGLAD